MPKLSATLPYLPVPCAVPAHHQVLWLTPTHVDVMVVLWHEIHVMEDEAIPVLLLQGFQVADVQQFRSVKFGIPGLQTNSVNNKRGGTDSRPAHRTRKAFCQDPVLVKHIYGILPTSQQLYPDVVAEETGPVG